MLIECPGCTKRFRAWIEGGHQYVEYADIHGEKHKVHADTCKCAKKNLIQEGKQNGRGV